MTKQELKEHYEAKINATESSFQKNILKAELKHKIEMLEKGITPDLSNSDECIGCSA